MNSKPFLIGAAFGIALFIAANLYNFLFTDTSVCVDCVRKYGFPIPSLSYVGYYGTYRIIWKGFILDFLFLMTFSFLVGWVVKQFFGKRFS